MPTRRTHPKVGPLPLSPTTFSSLIVFPSRPETAASVTYFARLLSQGTAEYCAERDLRVLDLCTGSGCIPLLFHYEFYSRRSNLDQRLDLVGIDVSPKALQLAKENLLSIQLSAQASEDEKHPSRLQSLTTLRFLHADVLSSQDDAQNTDGQPRGVMDALRRFHQSESPPTCDILISNPPYISSKAFRTTTARSVRHFEPKLALVPPNRSISGTSTHNGDVFYPRLLELAERLQTQVVLFEVADLDQAKRVASMGFGQGIWTGVEIWRDEPGAQVARPEEVVIDGKVVKVRGVGNGRSVFAYRGDGAEWLNRSCSQ